MSARLDVVLSRVDRALTTSLPVIPLQLGERGERLLLAVLVVFVALGSLPAPAKVSLPARVVHVPGLGWVDAASLAELPPSVQDGDRLVLAVVGRAAPQAESGVGGAGAVVPVVAVEPARGVEAVPPGAEPAHAAALGRKVSLNHASRAELEGLPGVGPALAARIEAARPFRSVRELDRVRGIGKKSLARLAPLVEP